jgi:hypothetical protein
MSVPAEASTEQVPPATTPARDTYTLQYLFFCMTMVGVALALGRAGGAELLILSFPLLVVCWLIEWRLSDGLRPTWFGTVLPFGLLITVFSFPSAMNSMARSPNTFSSRTKHQLKQAGLALFLANDQRGAIVPIVTVDDEGRPIHSWRAHLLLGLERPDLDRDYSWVEPWDGPNNSQFHGQIIRCFHYERPPRTLSATDAPFLAVDVPGGYPDGRFIVVEVPNSGINFFEPRDITLTELGRPGFRGGQKNGTHTHVLWLDGSVELVPVDKLVPRILNYMDEQRAEAAQRAKRP